MTVREVIASLDPAQCAGPHDPIRRALKEMTTASYSQLPVKAADGALVGVLTWRSYTEKVLLGARHDLAVCDYMEPAPPFLGGQDQLDLVHGRFERQEYVLVRDRGRIYVLTPFDLSQSLINVANFLRRFTDVENTIRVQPNEIFPAAARRYIEATGCRDLDPVIFQLNRRRNRIIHAKQFPTPSDFDLLERTRTILQIR